MGHDVSVMPHFCCQQPVTAMLLCNCYCSDLIIIGLVGFNHTVSITVRNKTDIIVTGSKGCGDRSSAAKG